MKSTKFLILSSAILLVACNNGSKDPFAPTTKKITDENALTRTQEILNHQNDESFKWPTKIGTVSEMLNKLDYKMPGQEAKTNEKITYNVGVDLDNIIFKNAQSISMNEITLNSIDNISFWKDEKFYTLKEESQNGVTTKSRTEEAMTKEAALEKLQQSYLALKDNAAKQSYLSDFADTIKEDQQKTQEAEKNPDSTYSYQYGSNNANSFERTILATQDETTEGTTLTKVVEKERLLFENNLLRLDSTYESETTEGDPQGYYYNEESKTTINFTYGDKVTIEIPNIDEYPLEEDNYGL